MGFEHKDRLKELLPEYLELLEEQGEIENRGDGFWTCPFCDSGNGSKHTAAFHVSGTRFNCFSCGAHGDIFDLVAYMEDLPDDWKKHYNRTLKIMRPYLEELPVKEETVSTDFTEESEKVQEDYTEYLMQCKKNVNETDYFAKRGLSGRTIDRFNLGYDPEKNIVTIPYNPDYKGYVHRVLWDANNKYSKHNNEIFNLNALHSDRSSHVFVCEGQIDAMSFEEAGFSAIGLGGVNEISKLIELIKKENTCNKTLIMALDNDKAGLRATGKFLEELSETKIKQRVVFDTGMYGGYKDANEFLMADRNGFAEMASSMTRK